jgi:multidrug efflux pump subunit AcrA (membrane-fusion protein)
MRPSSNRQTAGPFSLWNRAAAGTETCRSAPGSIGKARRTVAVDPSWTASSGLRIEYRADGVITAIPTEVGQVVQIGQTVMSLARTAELEAVVPIPEGQTDAISAAMPTVTLWSATGGGRSYNARLRELSPAADLTTRTYSTIASKLELGFSSIEASLALVSSRASRVEEL